MIYFKNQSGDVFAYESQAERHQYGPPELVLMTPDEVDAHINPPPVLPTREQIEEKRLLAYSDPLSGSDRYFAEAVRLRATGAPQEEIDAANAAGVQRYAEIQAEYPWP